MSKMTLLSGRTPSHIKNRFNQNLNGKNLLLEHNELANFETMLQEE